MVKFMATREDAKEPNRTGLESLSLGVLVERFANEIATYKIDLSTSPEERKELVTEEYKERIQPIIKELDKREEIYLKVHKDFIEH